jgi:hypothetical protein
MTRRRKALIGAGLAVLLLGGSVAFVPRLLWSDGTDYSAVASIKTSPEYQDAALLEKAWALPVASTYRQGLDFQRNPSFCGPTSVVNVTRSLGGSADQATVLEGTGVSTFLGLVPGGLTLDQLAAVAEKKLGRKVTVLCDLDLAAFRAQLQQANDSNVRLIANFHRGPLFGKGGGHFSPIAGYLPEDDLVFVLDVNDSFRPWLVKTQRLFEAIDTVDKQSGKKRGLLRIE